MTSPSPPIAVGSVGSWLPSVVHFRDTSAGTGPVTAKSAHVSTTLVIVSADEPLPDAGEIRIWIGAAAEPTSVAGNATWLPDETTASCSVDDSAGARHAAIAAVTRTMQVG